MDSAEPACIDFSSASVSVCTGAAAGSLTAAGAVADSKNNEHNSSANFGVTNLSPGCTSPPSTRLPAILSRKRGKQANGRHRPCRKRGGTGSGGWGRNPGLREIPLIVPQCRRTGSLGKRSAQESQKRAFANVPHNEVCEGVERIL